MSPEEFLARFPEHATSQELRDAGVKPAAGAKLNAPKPKAAAKKIASGPSRLEALFEQQLHGMRAPTPVREHRFHPDRNWRMDFAWPSHKLAVEVEGGVWGMGRHNRPKGFIADTEKYNAAAELGWVVLRFTGAAIRSGKAVDQTLGMLQARTPIARDSNFEEGVTVQRRARPKG